MSEESNQDQPQARKSPAIPTDMKAFNKKLIADFRANHGREIPIVVLDRA